MKKWRYLIFGLIIVFPYSVHAYRQTTTWSPSGTGIDWSDRYDYCLNYLERSFSKSWYKLAETKWIFVSSLQSKKVDFPKANSFLSDCVTVVETNVGETTRDSYLTAVGMKGVDEGWDDPGFLLHGRHHRYNENSYILYYYDESKDMDMWYIFNVAESKASGVYYEMHRGTGVESDLYELTGNIRRYVPPPTINPVSSR